jgi:hypothetical protein
LPMRSFIACFCASEICRESMYSIRLAFDSSISGAATLRLTASSLQPVVPTNMLAASMAIIKFRTVFMFLVCMIQRFIIFRAVFLILLNLEVFVADFDQLSIVVTE